MVQFVPPGIAGLLGLDDPKASWKDRIKEAAYTSPGGTRIKFAYEDVSRETTKRTANFSFPKVNDDYVQDNGYGSRRYPLRCFFYGKTCDREASAFETALLESGMGKLEHPLYGTINVVPFGDISRRDDLKSAANQAVVEVTFWTTTGIVYPLAKKDGKNEILASIDGFNVAAAQQFAGGTSFLNEIQKANGIGSVRKFLREVNAAMEDFSSPLDQASKDFRDLNSTINLGIDTFIGTPLLMAQHISNLVQAPGRALSGIFSRLEGYADLLERIMGSPQSNPASTLGATQEIPSRRRRVANDFAISDLFLTSTVSGSVLATAETSFSTKTEALLAAEKIRQQFDDAVEHRDDGFTALGGVSSIDTGLIDTGEAYQALANAVALAEGFLVQQSFTLLQERSIVLDRDRTIVDVCAELYGEVDTALDFLIKTNDLSGSEIIELPREKKIFFYSKAA